MSDLHDLLNILKNANYGTFSAEIANLQAIRDWAQRQACGALKAGDIVRTRAGYEVRNLNSDGSYNGWWNYRECLAGGAEVEVTAIKFSTHHGDWYAEIRPLREWSCGSGDPAPRYWHGPAAETPGGMEPPSQFDQDNYPDGRKHVFMFQLADLELPA